MSRQDKHFAFPVQLKHILPSGKYQVAMIPYKTNENGTLVAMGPPSCTCRLERLNLGKHALAIILGKVSNTYRVMQVLWDGMYYGTLSTAHL